MIGESIASVICRDTDTVFSELRPQFSECDEDVQYPLFPTPPP